MIRNHFDPFPEQIGRPRNVLSSAFSGFASVQYAEQARSVFRPLVRNGTPYLERTLPPRN
jgi:hypothetical protein